MQKDNMGVGESAKIAKDMRKNEITMRQTKNKLNLGVKSPAFFVANNAIDISIAHDNVDLVLSLPKDVESGEMAAVVCRNLFAVAFFNHYGYKDDVLQEALVTNAPATLEDIDMDPCGFYLTDRIYSEAIEAVGGRLHVAFDGWDRATHSVKVFMNTMVRNGIFRGESGTGILFFSLISAHPCEHFEKRDRETWCDREKILFTHEINQFIIADYRAVLEEES